MNHKVLSLPFAGPIHWWLMYLYASPDISTNYIFKKQSAHHRTLIMGPNKLQMLSLPCYRSDSEIYGFEIRLCYAQKWPLEHIRSLKAAYGKSPYFEFYMPEIEEILLSETPLLSNLNMRVFQKLCSWLKCNPVMSEVRVDPGIQILEKQFDFSPYHQVFGHKHGFISNLSILDLIFNLGPESRTYLQNQLTRLPSS